jgi:hypothetical protein
MWLELWRWTRWLLGYWAVLLLISGVIAATKVKPPLTEAQLVAIVAAPKRAYAALALEPGALARQTLPSGASRFITFQQASQEQNCAPYTEDPAALLRRLQLLPKDVFSLDGSTQSFNENISFFWTANNFNDIRYSGLIDTKQRLLCLEQTANTLELRGIGEQWNAQFPSAAFLILPLFPLGFGVFGLVLWADARYVASRILGALATLGGLSVSLFLSYWWFLFSLGVG